MFGKYLIILLLAMQLPACTLGVKPWQRDLLAKPQMALDSQPIQNSYNEHIYFSKEASSGGKGFGGGGCGCN
ncbi:DUF4266 domain-containing protein [Gynuella sunshinyii]|uniref:DUF4266 domain-containing protein n=1 Tax=Gynuella sunshinyii YC6258 TaxID=1445510 RepID=A0A0C5VGK7_9GAMM|nr:DUF4266 domain-containing protein [Gynuella sunshinyii]AJQ93722.1 hypothetical Protein YC6258_01674 [Gynuella sunshinyii YC6258]